MQPNNQMRAAVQMISWGLAAPLALLAAEDPFSPCDGETVRPERKIETVPSSVEQAVLPDGKHAVTITGIYDTSRSVKLEDPGSIYQGLVPSCVRCDLDFEKRTCTIVTSRRLNLSELAYAIDDLAEMGGDLPFWAELEARDIQKADGFQDDRYTVSRMKGDFPEGLAWFAISDEVPFSAPMVVDSLLHPGRVLIVPTTAHYMAHSRFAIRVLDHDGRMVWQDSSTAFADVRLAVADSDGDGVHELFVDRDDHGKETSFHIKPTINQE